MLETKLQTLLAVIEHQNFTHAARALSMTQPAVSHHIKQLEQEIGAPIFVRGKTGLILTDQGEIVKALDAKMYRELQNAEKHLTALRIGITHTSESNMIPTVLAKCCQQHSGLNITVVTDTIKNLYEMLENYELDLAIVEGSVNVTRFSSMMLDTDYLMCVMSNDNPLSKNAVVTLAQLKKEPMILRLPTSATRMLFESALESSNDSIANISVTLEVDNIATIKDLVRKDLGVSILPRSACLDELRSKKLTALPVENLSMARETRVVYNRDFSHVDILQEITMLYQKEIRLYH